MRNIDPVERVTASRNHHGAIFLPDQRCGGTAFEQTHAAIDILEVVSVVVILSSEAWLTAFQEDVE